MAGQAGQLEPIIGVCDLRPGPRIKQVSDDG